LPAEEKVAWPPRPPITTFTLRQQSRQWGFSFRPQIEFFLYAVTTKVTSDCLVDRLIDWGETAHERFPHIKTLLINLDNGPENHSRRTQFMQRLLEFVERYQITVRLAYYPPYHSTYNPVERCWGILEQHWNGSLLDSVEAVIQYASTMSLQRKTSGRRIGDEHLSNRRQIDKGGNGRRRNPTSALPVLGKVVCGYQVFSASYARE
jgi:transposase